jgi:hypothetical protein
MNKTPSFVGPVLAAILSLAGIIGFIVLFARDMTVYWFILSPLILIVYQFPAFVVFRMWKRKRDRSRVAQADPGESQVGASEAAGVSEGKEGAGPDAAPDPGPADKGRRETEG